MWFYNHISREAFEQRKDYVEHVMRECGASALNIKLPYEQKTISCSGDLQEIHYSQRPVFQFHHKYFRIDELLQTEKPFIVIECGTYDELIKNTMEDSDLFPYDLPDEEIKSIILTLLQEQE